MTESTLNTSRLSFTASSRTDGFRDAPSSSWTLCPGLDDGLRRVCGGRDDASTLANVIVVSSRFSAPQCNTLSEKSLELLTITLRPCSSASIAVGPPRPPRRRTIIPANHVRNLGVLLAVRRLGSDVLPSVSTASVSRWEHSGDWPPFSGIPDV